MDAKTGERITCAEEYLSREVLPEHLPEQRETAYDDGVALWQREQYGKYRLISCRLPSEKELSPENLREELK